MQSIICIYLSAVKDDKRAHKIGGSDDRLGLMVLEIDGGVLR